MKKVIIISIVSVFIILIAISIGIIIKMQSFNNKDIDTLVHNKYSSCVINDTTYEYTDWSSTVQETDDINKAEIAIVGITTNNEERVLYFEKETSLLNDLIFHKIAFKEIGDYPKYCTSEIYFEYWDTVFKVNSEGTFKYNYRDNVGWEKYEDRHMTYSNICFDNDYYGGQTFVFISKEEADKKIQELTDNN